MLDHQSLIYRFSTGDTQSVFFLFSRIEAKEKLLGDAVSFHKTTKN